MEQSSKTAVIEPAGKKGWLSGMVLWTAGILLVLGLVWLVAAVGVPAYQAHEAVSHTALFLYSPSYDYRRVPVMSTATMRALGGPERAAAKLDLYLRLPRVFTDRRGKAVQFLAACGKPAIPGLTRAISDPDGNVRLFAAQALGRLGPRAQSAIPALERTLRDEDKSVRTAAQLALREILGEDADAGKE